PVIVLTQSQSLACFPQGGFEPKMTKREAALIFSVTPYANRKFLKKTMMIPKHPDDGSPVMKLRICPGARDLLNVQPCNLQVSI
uniref:Uncharacterized protein n=1 Tax=Pundamilia nyererei TaxID=303518 RepID=A0A3B4GRQ4_9CICH